MCHGPLIKVEPTLVPCDEPSLQLVALKAGANGEAPFYQAKLDVGRFYMARVLPRHSTHFQGVMAGGETLGLLPAASF